MKHTNQSFEFIISTFEWNDIDAANKPADDMIDYKENPIFTRIT